MTLALIPTMLAAYKLPPTYKSLRTLAPPWIITAPLVIAVALVELVNVVIPPTPNVLFNCVAPPIVNAPAILAAPATLIPPFGTTTAPMPCAVVAILALAHRLLLAANTVNEPVDAVALPIGVELIAANCASPPMTLPGVANDAAVIVEVIILLANMLPETFKLAPVNSVPVLPINPELTAPAVIVVNVPVLGVALPIGVELIAENCASPPRTLPDKLIVAPVYTVPTLPTNPAAKLPTVASSAVTSCARTVLADTLPDKLILAPVNTVPVLPTKPATTLPNVASSAVTSCARTVLAATLPETLSAPPLNTAARTLPVVLI